MAIAAQQLATWRATRVLDGAETAMDLVAGGIPSIGIQEWLSSQSSSHRSPVIGIPIHSPLQDVSQQARDADAVTRSLESQATNEFVFERYSYPRGRTATIT